jgi:hypothetical protein
LGLADEIGRARHRHERDSSASWLMVAGVLMPPSSTQPQYW